jgi:hypothetical protein
MVELIQHDVGRLLGGHGLFQGFSQRLARRCEGQTNEDE